MSETLVTRDMGLVAYLHGRGRSYDRLERINARSAQWVFPDMGDLIGIVDEYYDGEASVEPIKFQRDLTYVRNELYDFLGRNRNPRRDGSSA